MSNIKRKLSTFLIISMMSAGLVCLAETYKNNVVDVRVNGEGGNAVKVVIYTDRPYTDPVVVNKKANNKYVILMPETNSLLKSSPTVTNGSGTISNVTVNTQSVSGGKGYTKITITSEKSINVVPKTQQIVSKPKPTSTAQTAKPVTSTQSTAQSKQDAQKKALAEKQRQEAIKKANIEKQKKAQAQKTAQQKSVQKPVTKPAQPAPAVKPAPAKQPIEVLEQEIKTGQYANVVQDKNDDVLNKAIDENTADNKDSKSKDKIITETNDKSAMHNLKSIIEGLKKINVWKLLLLLGAVALPIFVIMAILGMDKKTNRKIDETFNRNNDLGIDYSSQEQDIEPVTPQSSTRIPYREPIPEEQTYNSFDEMLDRVEETDSNISVQNVNSATSGFNNDYSDSDFEPEQQVEPVVETMPVSDIEPVVEENEEPAVSEPYNPDGYLSDFAGVNDKDFFEELTMQTMAENNSEGLPAQSPADEIFNFMSEDEVEPQIVEPVAPPVSNPIEQTVQTQEIEAQEESQEPVYETFKQGNDELTMLTEVKLNETTGIYLVNYDNFSSLVGHINDDYFVIKKFDEYVSGHISVKEAEKIHGAKRYLVRVGKNKMVVEVSETSMSRLLDL